MTRSLPRSLISWALRVTLVVTTACNPKLPGPDPDAPVQMRVRVSTIGGDPDLDGYVVLVDGQPRGSITATITVDGLTPGSHQVSLQGIAPNCDLTGPPVRDVVLPSTSFFDVSFDITCYATGLEVSVVTTGIDAGTEYTLTLKDLGDRALPVNSTTLIGRLPPSRHTLTLKLDPALTNCQIVGAAIKEVDVANRTVVPVSFTVTCVARFGAIQVLLQATGVDIDPSSYFASVDDGTPRRLSSTGTVVFDSLLGGPHTVRVSGGTANCTLTSSNPVIASVPVGGPGRQFAPVNFSASCVELERKIAFFRNPFGAPYFGYTPVIALVSEIGSTPIDLATGFSPTWSPDGLRIAFVRVVSGDCYYGCPPSGIFLMNRDGTGLVGLTGNTQDAEPAWSPNGAKIAFHRAADLYLMNADGSAPALLPTLPATDSREPAWSPDGARLAFTCRVVPDNPDICLINADGSGFVRLTSSAAAEFSPAWHPDGTRLAFALAQSAGNPTDVAVIDADGTDVTIVTRGGAPAWAPNGTRIYFVRDGALQSVNPDGSDRRTVLSNALGWNNGPVVRP